MPRKTIFLTVEITEKPDSLLKLLDNLNKFLQNQATQQIIDKFGISMRAGRGEYHEIVKYEL